MSRIAQLTVLALVLGLGVCWADNRYAERHGQENEKLSQGVEQAKMGEKQLARVDTVYKLDTIRLTKEVKKYQVLRDTARISDTVWVKEFVRQTDSTIQACLLTVQTCEQKDSAHKVIEGGLRKQNDALRALLPTKTQRFITATKWAAIGAVLGAALLHR